MFRLGGGLLGALLLALCVNGRAGAQIPPTGLTAMATGQSGQVNLSWTAPSDDAVLSYNLYWGPSGTAAPTIGSTTPQASVTPTALGLTPTTYTTSLPSADDGQPFSYWVTTMDGSGESQPDGPAYAASYVGPYVAPGAPSLSVQMLGYGALSLTPGTATQGTYALSYISVSAATVDNLPVWVATIPVTDTSGMGQLPVSTYGWVSLSAQAVDVAGDVGPSGPVIGVQEPQGPSIAAFGLSAGTPTAEVLSWAGEGSAAVAYIVAAGTNASTADPLPLTLAVTNQTSFTYVFTTTTAIENLLYRVYAVNANGVTSPAAADSVDKAYSYGVPQFASFNDPAPVTYTPASFSPVSFTATWAGAGSNQVGPLPGGLTYSLYGSTVSAQSTYTMLTFAAAAGGSLTITVQPQYLYYFMAVSDSAVSSPLTPPVSSVIFAPVLATPTVSAGQGAQSTVLLTWPGVIGATGYTIYRVDLSSTVGVDMVATGVGATSYTDTGSFVSGTYASSNPLVYVVQAYLNPISSTSTSPIQGTDYSAYSLPLQVPNPNTAPAPTLTAIANGLGGTVELSWSPVISPATNGLSSYDVYYSTQTSNPLAPPPQVTTLNVGKTVTALSLTGLQDGVLTWFWVAGSIGSNGSDAGAFSLPATAVPYTVPLAPTLTAANVLSFGQGLFIDVSHTSTPDVPLGAVQVFEIPIPGGVTSLVGTMDPSAPYLTLSAGTFPCGTPLSFTAQDVDIAGNTGTPSKAYWVEAPCSPTVQATLLGTAALTLNWTAPLGGASSYAIFSATGSGWLEDPLPNLVTDTSALSFPVPVTSGQSRWYRIYAVDKLGVSSSASDELGLLSPPSQVQAIPGSGQVYLSWVPPAAAADEGLNSYVVYYSSAAAFVAASPTSAFGTSPGASSLTVSSAAQGLTVGSLSNFTPYAFAVASGGPVSGSASAPVTMTTGLLGPVLSSVATSPPLGSSVSFFNPLTPSTPGPTAYLLAQWSLGQYTPLTSTVYSIYETLDPATVTAQTFSLPTLVTATTAVNLASFGNSVTFTAGSPGPVWYFLSVTDPSMTNDSGLDTTNARTVANAYFAPNLSATTLSLLAPVANGRILLQWNPVPFADSYTVYRATQDITTVGSLGVTYSALVSSLSATAFLSQGEVLEPLSYTSSDPLTFVDTAPVENARNAYEVVPLMHSPNGSVLAGPGSNAVTRTPRVLPQDPGFWEGAGGLDNAGISGFYVTAAAEANSGGVFLEWTPSGAGSYPISYYTVYRGFSPASMTYLTTTTWDVTGTATGITPMPNVVDTSPLQPLQDLYYGVQATDVSNNASPDTVTTMVSAPQLWPAPALVSDQYYSGSKQVALTWVPSTITAGILGTFPFAQWQVERVTALGASPTVVSLSPAAGSSLSAMTQTTAMDLSPVPGSSLYLITAVDDQGNIGPALGVSVTVGGPSATNLVPGMVTGLTAVASIVPVGSTITSSVYVLGQTLSWSPNPASDAVSAYEVFRQDGLVSTSDWALNPPYQDTTGTADAAGISVTYEVAAKNSHGLGVSSTPLTVYWSPPAPAWVSFTADIPSGVSQSPAVGLVWQDVLQLQGGHLEGDPYAGSYTVFRSDHPNTPLAGCSDLTLSAACTDVSPAASAYYYVESVLTNNNSALSNVGLAVSSTVTAALGPLVLPTTTPSAPWPVSATSGPAGVSLTWTASAGPCYCTVEYWIYRSSTPLTASPPYADFLARVTGTAFVDTGISGTAGLTYTTQTEPYYAVAAANPFQVGPATTATAGLSPPSALSAFAGSIGAPPALGSATVTLAWTPSLSGTLVTGYDVYRSTGGPLIDLGSVTGTGYTDVLTTDGGLTNSVMSYTAMAAGGGLVSACATPVTVTAYNLPKAPMGLSGTGTSTGVDLTWKPAGAAQGVTGYAVAWNVLNASGGGVTQVAASPAEWTLGGLLPAQAVTVTVQALNSAGASTPSAQVLITASAVGPAAVPVSFTVQSGLTPLAPGQSAVLLSFSATAATTVVIYRSPPLGAVLSASTGTASPLPLSDAAGGSVSPCYLTTVPASFTSLMDTAVSARYGYSYAITAVDAAGLPQGESVPLAASPTCVTAFDTWAPPAISATAGSARIDLWWTPPPIAGAGTYPLAGYRLYRKTGAGPVAVTAATPPDPGFPLTFSLTQTAYTDFAVSNGLTYSYGMTCVDTQGNESAVGAAPQYPLVDGTSSGLAPTGPLAPPTNITAIPGNNSVTLQWVTLQSDASSGGLYNVYRRLTTTTLPQYGPPSFGPPLANLFHVGPTIAAYPTGTSLEVESLVDAPFLPTSPQDKVMECYAITAVNASGEGPKSKDLCVTPFNSLDPALFPGSANLSATIEATTEVLLTWTQIPEAGNSNSGGSASGGYTVTGYHVYRSQDDGNTYTLLTPTVAETAGPTAANVPATFVDPNQTKGVSFYYRVVPVDYGGNEGLAYDLVFVDIPAGSNNLYVFRNSFDPKLGGSVPIQCGLSRVGMYWVKIYTLNGEYVCTLIPPTMSNSTNYLSPQVTWNGTNAKGQTVASGVYLIHLEGPGFHTDARVAVIK